MEKQERVDFASDYSLALSKNFNRNSSTYGIHIDIKGKNSLSANYTMKVLREKPNVFLFTREIPIVINQKKPEAHLEVLALKCNQVIFPLRISMISNGIFGDILNHQEITQRWKEEKPKLEKYYKGKVATTYMSIFEKKINDIKILRELLQADYFFSAYMLPIYNTYTARLMYEDYIHFPSFISVAPSKYLTMFRPKEFYTKNGFIEVNFNGVLDDERSYEDILNKSTAKYFLRESNITPISGHIDGEIILIKDKTIKNIKIFNKLVYNGSVKYLNIGIYKQFDNYEKPKFQKEKTLQFFIDEKPIKK